MTPQPATFQSAGRITIPGNRWDLGLQGAHQCFNPPGGSRYLGTLPRVADAGMLHAVSIRRADHDTWERRWQCDERQNSMGFNPPGGSRYLGTIARLLRLPLCQLVSIRRADHDTWEQCWGWRSATSPTRVSIRRADHDTWELGGCRRYPRYVHPVSIRRADHDTWELPCCWITLSTMARSFNPPGGSRYLGTQRVVNAPGVIQMFQSAGRITIPGNSTQRGFHPRSWSRFNPPGGSRYLGTRARNRQHRICGGFNPPGGSRYLGTIEPVAAR